MRRSSFTVVVYDVPSCGFRHAFPLVLLFSCGWALVQLQMPQLLTFPVTSAFDISAGRLLADFPTAASSATSAGSTPSPAAS
jgi:hypothetical protein